MSINPDKFLPLKMRETQIDILDMAERFCRENSPIEKVRALIKDGQGYDQTLWMQMVELGWPAVSIAQAHEGAGMSAAELVIIFESMGRYLLASPFLSVCLSLEAIYMGASAAQQKTLTRDILAGKIVTLAIHEPGHHQGRIEAKAKKIRDGYRLSGQKSLVMDLQVADWVIVHVLVDNRPAWIQVPRAAIARENIRRENLIDETARAYTFSLDGIEVTSTAMWTPDRAESVGAQVEKAASLFSAALLVGGIQACMEYTLAYLGQRKQFGRRIGSYQALKHTMVDIYVEYEKARSLLYGAAHGLDAGRAGEIAICMAKIRANDVLSQASDRAIQFHGGFGFTYECDAQLYRRRAIFHAALYGQSRMHKQKLAKLLF